MERAPCAQAMKSVNRISPKHLSAATTKFRSMSLAEKSALTDEIYQQQPNLLASCLVQLGASEHIFLRAPAVLSSRRAPCPCASNPALAL